MGECAGEVADAVGICGLAEFPFARMARVSGDVVAAPMQAAARIQ